MMLEVNNLCANYGESRVLHGVSLHVDQGEMVCLIGRNGVGKSTLLKSIVGLTDIQSGAIRLVGDPIVGWPTDRIARAGVAYIPEDRGLFPSLTVAENLLCGSFGFARGKRPDLKRVYDLFPRLSERRHQQSGSLSGGEQQMLAIGRALVAQPRLLLIDEFSEGLQPSIVAHIADVILAINREGVTVLLVEQNARLALRMCARGYIMQKGQVVAEGNSPELLAGEEALKEHLVI